MNELIADLDKFMEFQAQARDNVFNANHRNMMIRDHGYTEAMGLTIEELILTV